MRIPTIEPSRSTPNTSVIGWEKSEISEPVVLAISPVKFEGKLMSASCA